MSWTWLGLAVLVLLAFSMVDGYQKGFVKEVVSAFLVLISVVMVWLINPYVNQFIRENTSVYEKIQTASGSFVDSLADGKETMDEEEQNNPLPSRPSTKLSRMKYGVDDHPFCASIWSFTHSMNSFGISGTAFFACKCLYSVPCKAALRSPSSFASKVSSSIKMGVA